MVINMLLLERHVVLLLGRGPQFNILGPKSQTDHFPYTGLQPGVYRVN